MSAKPQSKLIKHRFGPNSVAALENELFAETSQKQSYITVPLLKFRKGMEHFIYFNKLKLVYLVYPKHLNYKLTSQKCQASPSHYLYTIPVIISKWYMVPASQFHHIKYNRSITSNSSPITTPFSRSPLVKGLPMHIVWCDKFTGQRILLANHQIITVAQIVGQHQSGLKRKSYGCTANCTPKSNFKRNCPCELQSQLIFHFIM